jgi:predicted nucleic acid-binding protein
MIRALDTNIFIYALDGRSEFCAAARALLETISGGDYQGVASVLVYTELMRKPSALALEALDSINNMRFLPVDKLIALEAASLSAAKDANIKAYDELHLATAVLAGAQEFWTNDHVLAKARVAGLRVRLLTEAI